MFLFRRLKLSCAIFAMLGLVAGCTSAWSARHPKIEVPAAPAHVAPANAASAMGQTAAPDSLPQRDPDNQINSVTVTPGGFSGYERSQIPEKGIFENERQEEKTSSPRATEKRVSRVSPRLQEMVSRGPRRKIDVLITLREDQRVPLLPRAPRRNFGTAQVPFDEEREKAILTLASARKESQLAFVQGADVEIQVLEHFWLANVFAASVSVTDIEALAQEARLVYLQPVLGGERPPAIADDDPHNDVADARVQIGSDYYFNQGLSWSRIGVIDTGVYDGHTLFNDIGAGSASRFGVRRDCVHGDDRCENTMGSQDYYVGDTHNHGTRTCAIISGNQNLGYEYRGVTKVIIDSWAVYDVVKGLDSKATVRALQRAVIHDDSVIVVQVQADDRADEAAINAMADCAYDCGSVVLAANGNYGPGQLASPARAHKVLGVGGISVNGGTIFSGQSYGCTPDGRLKPDILAPNYTECGAAGGVDALAVFGSTSGATPYAGAAAILTRNFLESEGSTVDAGQTYALMILWGNEVANFSLEKGAGFIKMATEGKLYWGKVTLAPSEAGITMEIPLEIPTGTSVVKSALWWPESGAKHHDIYLALVDPNGATTPSEHPGSVFQRTEAPASGPSTWTLQIQAPPILGVSEQPVYWAAHAGTVQ